MEVARERVLKTGYISSERSPYDAHNYRNTNMRIEYLNRTMRNSVKINELSKEAISILLQSKNVFYDPIKKSPNPSSKDTCKKDTCNDGETGRKSAGMNGSKLVQKPDETDISEGLHDL